MSETMAADAGDNLRTDLKQVVTDTEELLRATEGQAGAGTADLRARVRANLNQAKAGLLHAQEAAIAKAKAAGHVTDEYVHQNPWKSIGIAAGAGLLIGLLIGRR